jgi:hypothetical protein
MFSTRGHLARGVVLASVIFAYFVVYPEDAQAITAPIANFLTLLTASNSISPWLYGVVAVGIIAWAIVTTCGRRPMSP